MVVSGDSGSDPVARAKADLRREVRARRAARTREESAAAADGLAAQAVALLPRTPVRVAAYLSLPAEPGTGPLITAARALGHTVVVPRIDGDGLAWVRLDDDTALAPGPLGIAEPVGDPDGGLADVSVVLLPATAVDGAGHRLGQGGGYYDRALASVPTREDGGPLLVAVVHDDEVVADVPVAGHDRRVDAILTPTRALPAG